MMTPEQILTIGAYGFTQERFFAALEDAQVDLFCDIRARRGLRGSKYAFANSCRLQEQLKRLSIPYLHIKELAPSSTVREAQREDDSRCGISKRNRKELGDVFKQRYRTECLAEFDALQFLTQVASDVSRPVFFCVERLPGACHRSLVADELATQMGLAVKHLLP